MKKKNVLSLLLGGCCMLGAAALDLELRDGTRLRDIQFVRPALHGVTLITTSRTGQSHLVTVPFSAISIPSLYALRQYLRQDALPPGDSQYLDPPDCAASVSALDLYLRRKVLPSVILGNNSVYIRLGFPGNWRDTVSPSGAEAVSD